MPPRTLRSLAVVVAALVLLCGGRSLRAGQRVSEPYQGVTYIDRTETAPRAVHMHVLQIDLTAGGIRFKLSPPAGSREVVRQTTLDYLKREHAQLAINAQFFWPFPSPETDVVVIGIAASEGTVYSAFESPIQTYALIADAPGFNIDAGNRATIVHRDPAQPDRKHVLEPVTLWNTLSGSAQIVTDGIVTVPVYQDPQHSIAPLRPGGPNQYSNQHSWYNVVTARTAIGLSQDSRTLTLFTVDARGGSAGMTVGDVAETLIRDYGVWNALNLDGGGSTSMVVENPATNLPSVVNVSSDSPAGRTVGNSLAVFAEPRR
jgi:hypothetical protein